MTEQETGARAELWPSRQARQQACASFCEHLANGYSIDSFPDAGRKTLRYYAEEFPEDFPAEEIEAAARRGLLEWERIGKDGARGALAKFNASAWSLTMKNRLGWREPAELENRSILSGPGEAEDVGTLKPRSPETIALAVLALFAREEKAVDDTSPGDID